MRWSPMPGQRAKHWFFYFHYLALINQGKNSISDQIKGLFFLFLYQPLSDIRDIRRRNVLVYKSLNDFPTKKNVSEVVM